MNIHTKIKKSTAIVVIVIILIGFFWIFKSRLSGINKVDISQQQATQPPKPIEESSNKETKLIFAGNSERTVYKVKRDDKWIVMDNGQESPAYDQVAAPTFSQNNQSFAYAATANNQTYLVVNNVPQVTPYKEITNIAFSPNGIRLAYVANTGENFVIVVDNKVSKGYQQIGVLQTNTGDATLVFSPDSQKVAYKVITDNGAYVVVNQQAGRLYDNIANFNFSDNSTQFTYQAEEGNKQVTIVNNSVVSVNTVTQNPNSTPTPTPTNTVTSPTNTNTTNSTSTSSHYSSQQVFSGNSNLQYLTNCSGSSGVADCRP